MKSNLKKIKLSYCISDINKSLAFEWIVEHLNHQKFELNFILINCAKNSQIIKFLTQNNIEFISLDFSSKLDYIKLIFQVYKYLKNKKIQVIHCHLFKANLIGLTAAKLAGVQKIIYTRHHSDSNYKNSKKGVYLDKFLNAISTQIVAISKPVEEILTQWEKVPQHKVVYIPHGFDLDYFTNYNIEILNCLQKNYNPKDQRPVIGVISRFTAYKGIQYIIPAFQKLLKLYPNALLMMFNARGDYEKELNSLLQTLPSNNFVKIDFETNLSEIYRLFNVYVHVPDSYYSEAFGQTYIEALASNVPSIFTLSGIAHETIEHQKNAFVVDYKNTDQIYTGLVEILTNTELSQNLKANNSENKLEEFTIKKFINKLEILYSSKLK
ncbi:MAG: glycosyltransferase family 4 protein [Cytophagales bacterium]